MKITNKSKAMQGVWTATGLVMIPAGESRDVPNLSDKQLDRAKALPFLDVIAPKVMFEETRKLGGPIERPVIQLPVTQSDDIDKIRAELDAKGIDYDRRFGVEKLKALLET